jgi:hypothetical protein
VAYGLTWPTLGSGIILAVTPERFQAQQVSAGACLRCAPACCSPAQRMAVKQPQACW